ncbi:MAG: hypothetical protein AAF553_02270 [Pseudomonadota bacterium]
MAERIKSPPSFVAHFEGPEGKYAISYQPQDVWDGVIETEIGGQPMFWGADAIHREAGQVSIGGMSYGTEELWGDVFWFEIVLDGDLLPKQINYWGETGTGVWRTDVAVNA